MTVTVLKPKPIKINGFEGVMSGTSDGQVQWKITRIMQVEFEGTSADEQTAMDEMRSFVDAYSNARAGFFKKEKE